VCISSLRILIHNAYIYKKFRLNYCTHKTLFVASCKILWNHGFFEKLYSDILYIPKDITRQTMANNKKTLCAFRFLLHSHSQCTCASYRIQINLMINTYRILNIQAIINRQHGDKRFAYYRQCAG